MALSPSIPTSFVPKQPVSTGGKKYSTGSNILLIIGLVIFGLSILAAAGVFIYLKYEESIEAKKGAQLVAAQNNVNLDTVNDFVRLRDRLTSAKTILDEHVQLSQFFTALEGVTLSDVHYSQLTIDVADDRSASLTLKGEAKDFNALAAQSTALAGQKYIKSAIFSDIALDKASSMVTFTITAELDPAIVIESTAPATPVALPAASAPTSAVTSSLAPSSASSSDTSASQAFLPPSAPASADTGTAASQASSDAGTAGSSGDATDQGSTNFRNPSNP